MTSRRPRRSAGRPRRRRPPPTAPPPAACGPAAPPPPPRRRAPAPPPSEPAPPLPYDHVAPRREPGDQGRAGEARRGGAAGKADPDSFLTSLTRSDWPLQRVHRRGRGRRGTFASACTGSSSTRRASWSADGRHEHPVRGAFTFGFTPHQSVELFGAITARATATSAPREPGRTRPRADQVVRRSRCWAARGSRRVARGFTAGGELGFRFLSGDLRPVALAQLDVAVDRSGGDGGPAAARRRAASLPRRTSTTTWTTPSNLYDFTRPDGPHHRGRDVCLRHRRQQDAHGPRRRRAARTLHRPRRLRPFAEYHAQVVTASPDPRFASYGGNRNRDQHWLTFGLRARVVPGADARRWRQRGPALGRLRIRSAGAALGSHLRPQLPVRRGLVRAPGGRDPDGREGPRAVDWAPSSAASRTRPTASRSPRPWCRSRGSRAPGSRPIRTAASRASRCLPGPPRSRWPPPGSSRRRARRRWWRALRRRSTSRWSRRSSTATCAARSPIAPGAA